MAEPVAPFRKVEPQADFPALEREVLAFWDEHRTFDKLRSQNAGKPRWSFLDGPITANNPMGVHHAWGRTYKDVYNRYFAMTGRELRYQQGFDCQGLWVEVEVEKELKLKTKRDIEALVPGDREASVDKFVTACKDRVNHFARVQTDQSIRLGYWMDWDRTDADWAKSPDERKSYFTMGEGNNYTIWAFLKKCHERGMVYRGYDVMPWCGRCGVGISEQEMKEGYKFVEHRSVFVKFPLKDKPGENLLAWTTTPWTLTSNVAAAVNPELTYLRVRLKGEVYYVAKGAFKVNRMEGAGDDEEGDADAPAKAGKKREWLPDVPHLNTIEQMFKSKAGKEPFEVVGEVKGSEMVGWAYHGPFDELPAQNAPHGFPAEVARVVRERKWAGPVTGAASHRVIAWKDVGETEGTGIVHIAPGCGQEDFELGKENGLPPVAPLDEGGTFVDGFGPLCGKVAYDPATADVVFDHLKATDRLFTVERYVHKYPHCWRCKTELLYRLVDEWFIGMGPRETTEGFRGDVMKTVDKVTFLPESLNGRARERDWLWNMGDWMISKKRFWGLALPIWVDDVTGDFEVIGSREELQARAVEGWETFSGHTPHRPWVDKVKVRNPKTGNLMSRVPDVGNPWLDAGIVAFSTMGYNTDRAEWRKWYPADFITESFPGQFRNWFYALLAMSTMMGEGEAPFRNLLGFATVRDQFGRPMHKSDGNSIEFVGAANDGYELFHDLGPKEDAKAATAALPKGFTSTREETVEIKGQPVRRVVARYKPIGADVIRWLYCRHNPAANLNFGPEPADEVRSKLVFKLWNTYSLFTTCAAGDGFDPAAPEVPVAERPDFDRWLLSSVNLLAKEARPAFERYDVMAFALAAERFVDEHLSNWWVRRNKPRLWSKTAELDDAGRRDKLAAYQTLHTTLTTLCKLLAPCVPFVTEAMWRNLRRASEPDSVHLCDYPTADESLIDAELSTDMDALLRVVSLGGAARQAAKVKVRQPLAELAVAPADAAERRAVGRFREVIEDELNVKAVRIHDNANADEDLLRASYKANAKTLGPKLGSRMREVIAAFDAMPPGLIADHLEAARQVSVHMPGHQSDVMIDAADISVTYSAEPGWAGVTDRKTQVAVATTITDELKLEGLSRDVVRQVQEARKAAGLDMLDRIALHLGTASPDLARAVEAHRAAIATATQADQWLAAPPDGDAHTASVKIDGQPLTIALRKV